jgi:uncharacterized protein with PIN domain
VASGADAEPAQTKTMKRALCWRVELPFPLLSAKGDIMTECKMICQICEIEMEKQSGSRIANLPVGNNQIQTAMSEEWYKCSKCGRDQGFLDRRIA